MNKLKFCLVAIALSFVLTGCSVIQALDVIGKFAIETFEVLRETVEVNDNGEYWSIAAPDGEAEFFWNGHKAMTVINFQPFIDAGVDVNAVQLSHLARLENNQVIIEIEFSEEALENPAKTTPLDDFKNIVVFSRDNLKYHSDYDQFCIKPSGRGMVECLFKWAKNFIIHDVTGESQEHDIMFVMSPAPLIDAGVDPNNVAGWEYALVETMDEWGRMSFQYKFIKYFNLI